MSRSYTLLRSVRLCDGTICDLLYAVDTENGRSESRILEIAPYIRSSDLSPLTVIDAGALIALPPFADLHFHPAQASCDDRARVCAQESALAGGFDCALAILDAASTSVPLADDSGLCRFFPTVAPPSEGEDVDAAIAHAIEIGAIALCDHGAPIQSASHLYHVMRACAKADLPYFADPQDASFARGGVNTLSLANKFCRVHSPAVAESAQVAHLLALCAETGCRLHLQSVTTKESLEMIRCAKARGLHLTCETSPVYFLLSHNDLHFYDAVTCLDPPLRSPSDQMALLDAVCDGTIDAISSNHTPFAHSNTGCEGAACETAFALSYMALVRPNRLSMQELCRLFCEHPRAIASLPPAKTIAVGESATFNLLCQTDTVLQSHHLRCGARSPFLGQALPCMVGATVQNGAITAFLSDAIRRS